MNKEYYTGDYYKIDYGNPKTRQRIEKYWQVNKYDWGYTHPVYNKEGLIKSLAMKYYECDISFKSMLIEVSHDALKKRFDKCLIATNSGRLFLRVGQPFITAAIKYDKENMVHDIEEMDWYEQLQKTYSKTLTTVAAGNLLEGESEDDYAKEIICNLGTNYMGVLVKGTQPLREKWVPREGGARRVVNGNVVRTYARRSCMVRT